MRKTKQTKFFTSWTSYITGELNHIYNLILGGDKCNEEKQVSKRIVSDGSYILQRVVRKAYDEVK